LPGPSGEIQAYRGIPKLGAAERRDIQAQSGAWGDFVCAGLAGRPIDVGRVGAKDSVGLLAIDAVAGDEQPWQIDASEDGDVIPIDKAEGSELV
jgi:hypothetical protein